MSVIKFADLWKNHPLNWTPSESHPCRNPDGKWDKSLDNQCAIKMSIALSGAGMNLSACHERKCWLKGHKNHVLVAQALASWLARRAQFGTPKKFIKAKGVAAGDFQKTVTDSITGKNGIVFCQNFWGAGNQGDHIDVWNGMAMGGNLVHDYFGRSEQVWFWEIKGMKKFCFLFVFALFALPSAAKAQETFKLKKSPYSFELKEKGGRCVLSYTKKGFAKELALDLSPTCKVVRIGATNQVIEHYYGDIKATVFMVGGEVGKGNCRGEAAASTQTVLIRAGGLKAGKKREGACVTDGPDEKEFWLGSH